MSQPIALVTGASRGIGAAIAKLLAKQGYAVGVNYFQSEAKADQVVKDIMALGGRAVAIQADMSKENQIIAMFERLDRELGPVTVLVNNAGINGGVSKVVDTQWATLEKVFSTNVFGVFIACREAVSRMQSVGGGSIVNISSEAGKFGGTNISHYAASKAAINTFTVGFAREVAQDKIRVNAVSPGVIDTPMHQASSLERLKKLLGSLPMGRMGQPEEVAQVVMSLVSDEMGYVSGAIIPVSGAR